MMEYHLRLAKSHVVAVKDEDVARDFFKDANDIRCKISNDKELAFHTLDLIMYLGYAEDSANVGDKRMMEYHLRRAMPHVVAVNDEDIDKEATEIRRMISNGKDTSCNQL